MRIFSYEELDELGEGLIRQYLGKEAERTCCVDIEGFVTDFLKLPLLYRSFAEEDSDKIGFIADGVTPLRVYENGAVVRRVYPGGTIVIERCLRREHESGRRRFTISHECAHYIMDRAVVGALVADGEAPSATSAPTTSWTGLFPLLLSTESLITSASTLRRTSKTCSAFGRRRLTAWVLLS